MMAKKLRLLALTGMITVLVLASCSPAAPTTAPQQPAATSAPPAAAPTEVVESYIRIATPNKVATMDPIKSAAAGDITVLGQIYSRLLRINSAGELEGALAERWEESSDKKTYTIHLRDAQFSDGSPITAEDVVFSFVRLRDQEDSAYPGAFQIIENVEAADEKTVVFTLDAPAGTFLGSLEMFNAGIVSKNAVESMGEEAHAQDPVASGPYMVREWRPNDRLVLERNPNYWRQGYPKIDLVEILEVPTDNTRVSMLRTGEVDVIVGTPWVILEEMKNDSNISVPLDPSTVINIVLLNHTSEDLQDVRVRKAMAMALDIPTIVNTVTFGNGTPANSLIPNSLLYYNPDLPAIEYNPDEARRLLEEADAVGTEIEFLVVAGGSGSEQITLLTMSQLDAVGFKTTVTQVDLGTWWSRIPSGEYDATITWWYNETADPDLAVRWALCGSCGSDSFYTFYNNERVNELTEAGLREPDPEKRRAIYHEIQQIALDDVAQIPFYYQPYSNALRSNVKNLVMTPAIQWTLEEATVDR